MNSNRRLNDLMQHRIRDVLLVSTLYDAYTLQEDGHLTEKVYLEYRELQLSSAPRFWHVGSGAAAVEALDTRRFDLVLIVSRVPGMTVSEFARLVGDRYPGAAVVLLTFDVAEHARLGELRRDVALDGIFAWSGDAKILLALSKYVEDARNVDQDIGVADVGVILLVEDSIRFYSSYLTALYPELMTQSQSLFAEGRNRLQKLLRMRTRPKILLAQDFEQACHLFDRYQSHLLALISDVGFPRGGQEDPRAGLALVERARRKSPDLPVLLQSAEASCFEEARELNVLFVNKHSTLLLQKIRAFLSDHIGFGPFVFRSPDGREIQRAWNMTELATRIADLPSESLAYHTSRNHFSTWLKARSEFTLASRIRPHRLEDFDSIEDLRTATVLEFKRHARARQSGVVSDFSPHSFESVSAVHRVGLGSLGGKARGIAFLDKQISAQQTLLGSSRLAVRVPESFVLATNAFDEFLAANDLFALAARSDSDETIASKFLAAKLPSHTSDALFTIAKNVQYPLAVRSSSLLEDDMLRPFVGVYAGVLLSNQAHDVNRRLHELSQAVKLLYASTFFERSRRQMKEVGRRIEEEKMAVMVQRVMGRAHGNLFYPFCSGLAESRNFYALPPQRASEGAVRLVFGLGPTWSRPAVRFSPVRPHHQPGYLPLEERRDSAQRSFRALVLDRQLTIEGASQVPIVEERSLDDLTDPHLSFAVSLFVPGARAMAAMEDGTGERVVTFDKLLQQANGLPLATTLRSLLDLAVAGVGKSVEMEFCVDLVLSQSDGPSATIYPLQIRPRERRRGYSRSEEGLGEVKCMCRASRAFGPSPVEPIHDVILVRTDASSSKEDRECAAEEIGKMNDQLVLEGRSYLLIGPGRWGQLERGGIGVYWEQISGARVFVEKWPSDVSRLPVGIGFSNKVSQENACYLLLPPNSSDAYKPNGPFLDRCLLEAHPSVNETAHVRHLRFEHPLLIRFDETDIGAEILVVDDPRDDDATIPASSQSSERRK